MNVPMATWALLKLLKTAKIFKNSGIPLPPQVFEIIIHVLEGFLMQFWPHAIRSLFSIRQVMPFFYGLLMAFSITAHAAPFAYIANTNSNNVSVIDLSNNTVLTTVGVGSGPYGIGVNPAGTFVYVPAYSSNSVSVIDTSTNTVTATVAVGANPYGVTVNPSGTRAYVANTGGSTVSVINTANNTVAATINVGNGPYGLVLNPAGTRLYVTNLNSNSVSVIDTGNNTVLSTVSVGMGPGGIAIHPSGSTVYVANQGGNSLSVIDTSTNAVTATISVGSLPVAIALNANGSALYVSNQNTNNVSIVNPSNNSVVGSINVGSQPRGISLTANGSRLYVVNQGSDNVSVIDTSNNSVVTTVGVNSTPNSFGTFIVAPAPAAVPTVTNISPASGSTAGATSVTLTGTNFTGATGVTVGGVACTNLAVVSATSITCSTPAGTAGTASVLVTTSVGTNVANTLFTYRTVGSCGGAGGGAALIKPASNLCSVGSASAVALGSSSWTWTCAGTLSTASCSAPFQPTPGNSNSGAVSAATTNGWTLQAGASFVAAPALAAPIPAGTTFPVGLTSFTLVGGVQGSQATVTITYASPLPANAVYYKYNQNTSQWSVFPNAVFNYGSNSVVLTLVDGGIGDADGIANGTIVDPGGPGVPASAASTTGVPTLSQWALGLLVLLVTAIALYEGRRGGVHAGDRPAAGTDGLH